MEKTIDYVRGRTADNAYLEPEILRILGEETVPMSALGINFRVNGKLDKIVELNAIKRQLNSLVKEGKVLKKDVDDTPFYRIDTRNKSV